MRKIAFASLFALFLLAFAAGPASAATAEQPAPAPAPILTLEAPATCPSMVAEVPSGLFSPGTSYSCQVNSDCFNYCCVTYGACSGDSLCRRGLCLC